MSRFFLGFRLSGTILVDPLGSVVPNREISGQISLE
jgi:hypothetical protein